MNGLCDVEGCTRATYLGWRPLKESMGRQICEYHWCRHRNEQVSFNLFDEFGFKRPAGIRRPVTNKDISRCFCGRERLSGHKYCTACAAERERQRKKRAYHERKNPEHEPIVRENNLKCKACGGLREPGHTYCPKCSKEHRRQGNRERQRRHYRITVKCAGLT